MISVLRYHKELDRAVRHGFDPTEQGIEDYRNSVVRRASARQQREFNKRRAIQIAEARERQLAEMSSGMDPQTAQGMVNAQLQAMAAIRQYPSHGSSSMPQNYPMVEWHNPYQNRGAFGMTQSEILDAASKLAQDRSKLK